MDKEFVPYQQALELKELGFDEPCFGKFYTKPKCKMFGIDEEGRAYPMKNTPKKLYTIGEDCVLNDSNVIVAPLYQQAFRWLLEKHNLYGIIIPTVTMAWTFKTMTAVTGMVEVPPYNHVDAYDYSRREEAELACLQKLIELAKNK
jgi:hypothetical protein